MIRRNLSKRLSGHWSGFCLSHGSKIVWTMVWLRCDEWSFQFDQVRLETTLIANRAHTVFRGHFSLISGNFARGRSYQRFLSSATVWSKVTSGWHLKMASVFCFFFTASVTFTSNPFPLQYRPFHVDSLMRYFRCSYLKIYWEYKIKWFQKNK